MYFGRLDLIGKGEHGQTKKRLQKFLAEVGSTEQSFEKYYQGYVSRMGSVSQSAERIRAHVERMKYSLEHIDDIAYLNTSPVEIMEEPAAQEIITVQLNEHHSRRGRPTGVSRHIIQVEKIKEQSDHTILVRLMDAVAGFPAGHMIAVQQSEIILKEEAAS
jgi:hypothetical protein